MPDTSKLNAKQQARAVAVLASAEFAKAWRRNYRWTSDDMQKFAARLATQIMTGDIVPAPGRAANVAGDVAHKATRRARGKVAVALVGDELQGL